MRGFSHQLIAVATCALGASVSDLPFGPIEVAACAFGALLPDIDHPDSKLGRRIFPISLLLRLTIGHRGPTHSLWAVLLLTFAGLWLEAPTAILFAMVAGLAAHLACDSLTPSGIPVFWPHPLRCSLVREASMSKLVEVGLSVLSSLYLLLLLKS